MKSFLLKFTRPLASKISSPKTTVLLIHNGQPKNLYYAKEFLSSQLVEHHKVPSFLAKFTIDKCLDFNKNLLECMEDYTENLELSNYFENLSRNLEDKLTKRASFGGPYKVNYSFAFPISDNDHSIEGCLMKMISKDGTQRFVVLPMNPVSGNKTNKYFREKIDGFINKHTELVDDEHPNLKVVKNYPVSFDYSFINQWFNENFVVNYWVKRLEEICIDPEEAPDMIIFTIPNVDIPEDNKEKEEFIGNYKNICGEIIKKLGFPSSWRSTFYDTWNSLTPTNVFDRSNLIASIKEHQKKSKKSIIVVPVFDFIPSFDTITLLPKIASQKNVRFLEPPNNVEFLSENFTNIIEKELLD